jgi:hypothetical protein
MPHSLASGSRAIVASMSIKALQWRCVPLETTNLDKLRHFAAIVSGYGGIIHPELRRSICRDAVVRP